MDADKLEEAWLKHRESLEQLFSTTEPLWERLKFNFKQGCVVGYKAGYTEGYDDGMSDGPPDNLYDTAVKAAINAK